MSETDLNDTQPTSAIGDTQPNPSQKNTPMHTESTPKRTLLDLLKRKPKGMEDRSKQKPAGDANFKSVKKIPKVGKRKAKDTSEGDSVTPLPAQGKNKNRGFSGWLIVLCVLVLIIIGALAGYSSGMSQRYAAQNTLEAGQLEEQFLLGQQAYDAGNYELAKTYFEGIIRTDATFPGITAAYADLLLKMQATPTPVFSPTPEVSPTPDLRGVEEIFTTAQNLLNSRDWNGAITNLDSLRKSNPDYRTAEVDGMYFTALRERGVQKIATGCQDVNLEGGIYDLTLAERFVGEGNLDAYAESLRTYARYYIIGASFWDQDWVQAQYFFGMVMAAYPNMTDSSCKSASTRWAEATARTADAYLSVGDTCAAEALYATAFVVYNPEIAKFYPTATAVSLLCDGSGGGDAGGTGGGETPTPEGPLPPSPTP